MTKINTTIQYNYLKGNGLDKHTILRHLSIFTIHNHKRHLIFTAYIHDELNNPNEPKHERNWRKMRRLSAILTD